MLCGVWKVMVCIYIGRREGGVVCVCVCLGGVGEIDFYSEMFLIQWSTVYSDGKSEGGSRDGGGVV